MKPFLKWAGGKYKIIDRVLSTLPPGQGKHLIEPFVGSGAVFLNTDYENYLLADTNQDLINLYKYIQKEGANFIDYAAPLFSTTNNTEAHFYQLRDEFNACTNLKRRAALFIYLNRHGFNGLCRYNASGKFNVPFGRYSKPIFPIPEILNFYQKSQKANFIISDFRTTMNAAKGLNSTNLREVIYCDPPYAPLTATANFSDYTQNGFSLNDQAELATLAGILQKRGIPVIISNHDTEFTRTIYQGADILNFDVQRFISSKAQHRHKAAELIAKFY